MSSPLSLSILPPFLAQMHAYCACSVCFSLSSLTPLHPLSFSPLHWLELHRGTLISPVQKGRHYHKQKNEDLEPGKNYSLFCEEWEECKRMTERFQFSCAGAMPLSVANIGYWEKDPPQDPAYILTADDFNSSISHFDDRTRGVGVGGLGALIWISRYPKCFYRTELWRLVLSSQPVIHNGR